MTEFWNESHETVLYKLRPARLSLASSPCHPSTGKSCPGIFEGQSTATRTDEARHSQDDDDDEAEYHTLEKILSYSSESGMFHGEWLCHDKPKREHSDHLLYNQIVQYFRRSKRKMPGCLKKYCTGMRN